MSYNIIQNDDMILVEGINFINLKYPEYDPEKFCDLESNSYYSIEMIQESLKDYNGIFEELISILIFDFLIGNSDRHQSNWALVNEKERWSLSPMYDNSSSLCAYVSNQQIEQYMGKDKMLWNALVDSKSRSLIRIGVTDKKRPTHLEVMNYLNQRYPDIVRTYERRIKQRITEQNIEKILKDYTDEELSFQRKMLIKKYLLCKKNMFVQLVEGKEEKE